MANKLSKEQLEQKKLLVQAKKLEILSSVIQQRSAVAARLGKSFGNKRDLYETLGYPSLEGLTHENFLAKYRRQDIAQRIVKAMPDESWEKIPEITDESESESSFGKSWKELVKKFKIYSVFKRADILSGIGNYSVLMIGFNDGRDPREPVQRASEILYLQPYGQWSAVINKLDPDPKSPRYNRPESYRISFSEPAYIGDAVQLRELEVHHSRVIHIARNLLESEISGTPELEPIYNLLNNLELISGGSAEMFWQGAMRGLAFIADKEYDITEKAAELTAEIDKYVHGLQRYMKLQGLDVKSLEPNIASPRDAFDIQIDLIGAAKAMPKRILMGSERGELASTQDDEAWTSRVETRRVDFNENVILRPFIDKMIELGVMEGPPGEEYSIEWPPLTAPTPKDKAEVGKTVSQAIREFYSSPGNESIPLDVFLSEIMDFPEEKVNRIRDEAERLLRDLQKEDEEGREFEEQMTEEPIPEEEEVVSE